MFTCEFFFFRLSFLCSFSLRFLQLLLLFLILCFTFVLALIFNIRIRSVARIKNTVYSLLYCASSFASNIFISFHLFFEFLFRIGLKFVWMLSIRSLYQIFCHIRFTQKPGPKRAKTLHFNNKWIFLKFRLFHLILWWWCDAKFKSYALRIRICRYCGARNLKKMRRSWNEKNVFCYRFLEATKWNSNFQLELYWVKCISLFQLKSIFLITPSVFAITRFSILICRWRTTLVHEN